MRPLVELGHLKYFYFAVVEGGVGRAADRLHVQQPVVSKMIKNLEDQLGRPLFVKAGRGKALTDFGQLVFRHSQTIFDEIEKLGQLEVRNAELTGDLNIAAAEPVAAGLLPEAIAQLRVTHPALNPNVYTATATELLQMLSAGKLDVGYFFHMPPLPGNLEIEERYPVPFRLVVARGERRNAETLSRFIGSREIDDRGNQKFPTVEKLRRRYPKARIHISSNHLGLHRELVLRGQGVSILPEFLVREDLRAKRLADALPGEKFVFDLKVVRRRGGEASRAVRTLNEVLIHNLAE
ncbi:MAG: LysR family transcriptional regulator [Bdellovibrionaceae bacterium]|nr:LysR family transcriptional regulator [Pseudobdellovibrionaceae bacterium]